MSLDTCSDNHAGITYEEGGTWGGWKCCPVCQTEEERALLEAKVEELEARIEELEERVAESI